MKKALELVRKFQGRILVFGSDQPAAVLEPLLGGEKKKVQNQ